MPKIKDLITLPVVETVIQLSKVQHAGATLDDLPENERQYLYSLADSFALTADIETNLKIILEAISRNHGRGFFLTGSFGSGKSHFLSVLSLLLQSDAHLERLWEPLIRQQEKLRTFLTLLKRKKLLVVEIPLLAHKASRPLEEIVLEVIQARLASGAYQLDVSLAEETYFLQQFEKYLLPLHRNALEKTIRQRYTDINTWDRMRDQHPSALYQITRRYLDDLPEAVPFKLSLDREEGFDRLTEILKANRIDGVVLLMDELSEFLKSKHHAHSLNEDARFLQYLGERSATHPLWVVAALQEHIEKTGAIQKAVIDKIKDRYEAHLTLSTQHIRELIDYRLILKKPDSRPHLKTAYQQLKHSFNDIPMSAEQFAEIYPVHPETLDVLDACADLFSQRRGVVDFIHHQIKGDASRHIEGILEEDFTHLLTPDRVFDHFENRLRESPPLRQYYDLYHDYFRKKIPRLFTEEPRDGVYALRLVKILIVLRIAHFQQPRTIRQLANMLLYQAIPDLAGAVNYDYLAGHMLPRLMAELSYLRLTPANNGDKLAATLEIDLAATTTEIFADQVRQIKQNLDVPHMLESLLDTLDDGRLPLARFKGQAQTVATAWQNTRREGQVLLTDLLHIEAGDMQQFLRTLKTTEADFVLLIGLPHQTDEQEERMRRLLAGFSERFVNGLLAWVPAPFSDFSLLSDWFAYDRVAAKHRDSQTDEAQGLVHMAETRLEAVRPPLREAVLECYRKGRFVYGSGADFAFEFDTGAYRGFEELLQLIIREPLARVYPRHEAIRTEMMMASQMTVQELVEKLVVQGQVEALEAAHQTQIRQFVQGIAVPLGLARLDRRQQQARLSVDLKKSPGCAAILEAVKALGEKRED